MPRRWISYLVLLGAASLAAVVVGSLVGHTGAVVAAFLAGWLIWTLRKLYELDRVLEGKKSPSIRATSGLWAELLARIERHKEKARSRKKKYHRLLREVRESTGALHDAGVILNAHNEIQWFNSAAKSLLGFDSARDLGQRIDNLVRHPDFVTLVNDADDRPIFIPAPKTPRSAFPCRSSPTAEVSDWRYSGT